MLKPSRAISMAQGYFVRPPTTRKMRKSFVEQLAWAGFDPLIISSVLNMRLHAVIKITGQVIPRPVWGRFNPQTLDALYLIAVGWEDDEEISVKLVKFVVQNGTDMRTVAKLTGIPFERLRECLTV